MLSNRISIKLMLDLDKNLNLIFVKAASIWFWHCSNLLPKKSPSVCDCSWSIKWLCCRIVLLFGESSLFDTYYCTAIFCFTNNSKSEIYACISISTNSVWISENSYCTSTIGSYYCYCSACTTSVSFSFTCTTSFSFSFFTCTNSFSFSFSFSFSSFSCSAEILASPSSLIGSVGVQSPI